MFIDHTLESAPTASRPILEKAKKKFGVVPAPLAKLAASPKFLEAFEGGNVFWHATSLSPVQREVVTMVVARFNGCHYCVALHTQLLVALRADAETIEALRAGTPLPTPSLEALARFTRTLLETRGAVPDDEQRAFVDAGYTPEQALEVLVGVGTYTLTTMANRLARVELDPGLRRYAWSPE